MSTYQENRRRLNRARSSSSAARQQDFMKGLQQFGGALAAPFTENTFADFLGEYILGLPFKELRDIKKTETETETELPSPPDAPPQASDLSGKEFLKQQYDRYFGSPEFDNVFGSGARGEGAPKDAAAMEILGNQLSAPEKDTNISSMYAAQSAMGRVNEDKIQQMYADRPDLQEWAKRNPMLAQREYLKAERRRANEMPLAPDNETVMGDLGSRAQMDNPMGQEAYDRIKKGLMDKAAQK